MSSVFSNLSAIMPPAAEDQRLMIISNKSRLMSTFGSASFMTPGVQSVLIQKLQLPKEEESGSDGSWLLLLSDESRYLRQN